MVEEPVVSRTVRGFVPVPGPSEAIEQAFLADPRHWIPTARAQGDGTLQSIVRAGALSRHVRLEIGRPWRNGMTIWRQVQWDPVGGAGEPAALDRWLPSFDGELGLNRRRRRAHVTLVLDGRYAPPGGHVGMAIDAAGMGRVAQLTVDRFLADVAAGLTAESLLTNPAIARPERSALADPSTAG